MIAKKNNFTFPDVPSIYVYLCAVSTPSEECEFIRVMILSMAFLLYYLNASFRFRDSLLGTNDRKGVSSSSLACMPLWHLICHCGKEDNGEDSR